MKWWMGVSEDRRHIGNHRFYIFRVLASELKHTFYLFYTIDYTDTHIHTHIT